MEKSKYLSPMFLLTGDDDVIIDDPWSQNDNPYDEDATFEVDGE